MIIVAFSLYGDPPEPFLISNGIHRGLQTGTLHEGSTTSHVFRPNLGHPGCWDRTARRPSMVMHLAFSSPALELTPRQRMFENIPLVWFMLTAVGCADISPQGHVLAQSEGQIYLRFYAGIRYGISGGEYQPDLLSQSNL